MFLLHQQVAWNHTAAIVSMVFNTTRTKPGECKAAEEFNPLADLSPFDEDGRVVRPEMLTPSELKVHLENCVILD